MPFETISDLANKLIPVAQAAGRVEMDIYQQDFEVFTKADDSPVTMADRAAEEIILKALAEIAPDVPVIAEEAASEGHLPAIGDRFFLVDPLDGTKEFINKSKEFTVNIALIEKGQPVFGLVYAPALMELYVTLDAKEVVRGKLDPFAPLQSLVDLELQPIHCRLPSSDGLIVVASKSHMTAETKEFIATRSVSDLQSIGSSLKFCLLARGDADLYPRFGPTMEWDTAAGHAVLKAAGGQVDTLDGDPLSYGKVEQNFRNPFFVAKTQGQG